MANRKHNTLTADTVDTVTLGDRNYDQVMVTNRSGGNPIYFRVDGTAPTVEGDDTFVVAASAWAHKTIGLPDKESLQVKLISAGAEDYSVEAV